MSLLFGEGGGGGREEEQLGNKSHCICQPSSKCLCSHPPVFPVSILTYTVISKSRFFQCLRFHF